MNVKWPCTKKQFLKSLHGLNITHGKFSLENYRQDSHCNLSALCSEWLMSVHASCENKEGHGFIVMRLF